MEARYVLGLVLGLGLILTVMLFSVQIAVAQEHELPDPGVTPDSWIYGFKRFSEGVDIIFTFDGPTRAVKHVNYAALRLSEARAMAQGGRPEFVGSLVKDYENNMHASSETAELARRIGKDTTIVEQLVAQATSTHLTVLAGIYEKVPEQARLAIEKAMNVSMRSRETAVEALRQKNALGNIPEEIPLSEEVRGKIPENVSMGRGNFTLLVSDAEADIADFESLIVTFSEARVFRSGESAGFNKFTPDKSVDLTEVVGESAISVLEVSLDDGTYTRVELYVSEVDGIVNDISVNVMVPSGKLQIIKPFVIKDGEETTFVFDINVVKKGQTDEYNLLPVIEKSGVVGKDLPEDEVEEEECTVDEDCKENDVCTDNVCVDVEELECTDDTGCDENEVCTDNVCVDVEEEPEIECTGDEDCDENETCVEGECEVA